MYSRNNGSNVIVRETLYCGRWRKSKKGQTCVHPFKAAEKKGFEPLKPFQAYTLSRRAGSTTPALLRLSFPE